MATTSRHQGDIHDLCIALRHRWMPDTIFMILTAYLDESGTHDDSVTTVMGGVMANALQWERFESKYRRVKKEFGFKIFHAKDFKHKTGEFKGWDNDKCLALVDTLGRITERAFMEGMTFAVNNADYDSDFKKTTTDPKKLRVPSKYGLCFQECLEHFLSVADKRRFRGKLPKLYIVCEAGPRNEGDALRIFREYKESLDRSGDRILETITFTEKRDADPLQIADFLSHTRWWREEKNVKITPDDIVPEGSKRFGITMLGYKPEGLAGRKQQLIAALGKRRPKTSDAPPTDSGAE